MRLPLTRTIFLLLSIIFLFTIFHLMKSVVFPENIKCNNSVGFMNSLMSLTKEVHEILSMLGLTHFLCFGSLWGQIRWSGVAPWAANTQFCLLNEKLLQLNTADRFRKAFSVKGLVLEYSAMDGMFTVKDPMRKEMLVEIYLFRFDAELKSYRRMGWKRNYLPPDCDAFTTMQCFPASLVEPPIPYVQFGPHLLPAPREGVEIQKYHYPHNWWMEVKPKDC